MELVTDVLGQALKFGIACWGKGHSSSGHGEGAIILKCRPMTSKNLSNHQIYPEASNKRKNLLKIL
jgi:hypothetical protein